MYFSYEPVLSEQFNNGGIYGSKIHNETKKTV